MELWFKETHTADLGMVVKVKETLHREKTRYQDLMIVDTYQFGRTLVLDGYIQTTERDEFIYHEMLVHVPLMAHADPERVLVIGGGDGGAIREVVRHKKVERAFLVDIDERVVAACREYLPSLSSALDDPRVTVTIEDGIEYVKRFKEAFDVIIVDSTDPLGPSVGLFDRSFYESARDALRSGGILVAQSEQVMFQPDTVRDIVTTLGAIFPVTKLYLAWVPTYSAWGYGFTIATKGPDPAVISNDDLEGKTRYYSTEVHRAAFVLPPFVKEIIGQE